MLKPGDVVFFKKVRTGLDRKDIEVGFKGYGYAVFMGALAPQQAPPRADQLLRLMGVIGYVSFDDVIALLGEKAGQELVRKFEDKYYGQFPKDGVIVGIDPAVPGADKTVTQTIESPDGKLKLVTNEEIQ